MRNSKMTRVDDAISERVSLREKGKRIMDDARRFVEDLERLDKSISEVLSSNVPEESKQAVLTMLYEQKARLRSEYGADVETPENELEQDMTELAREDADYAQSAQEAGQNISDSMVTRVADKSHMETAQKEMKELSRTFWREQATTESDKEGQFSAISEMTNRIRRS